MYLARAFDYDVDRTLGKMTDVGGQESNDNHDILVIVVDTKLISINR